MFKIKYRALFIFSILFSPVCADPLESAISSEHTLFQLDDDFDENPIESSQELDNSVSIINQIPDSMSIGVLQRVVEQLMIADTYTSQIQQEILEKLVLSFISCVHEHALQVLHDTAREMQSLVYCQDHPIKSIVTQPITAFTEKINNRYKQLVGIRDRYFELLGSVAVVHTKRAEFANVYEWLNHVLDKTALLHRASHIARDNYKEALQRLYKAGEIVRTNDALLCKRGQTMIGNTIGNVLGWVMRTGAAVGMCAGGGYLISKYLANINAPDIAAIKENYKCTVRQFHRQYIIPPVNGQPVTNAMIDAAAESLDTGFLEDYVIPAVTHRISAVPDWMPTMVAEAVDVRQQWMPHRVEEILRKIPARTFAVATTIIWLTDKTICDVLPWGIETVVGATAWLSAAAFTDRIVAIADAVITAAGGLTVAPDMGMLLALVYKKKLKLTALKYGGGAAGFLGLYMMYRTIKKYYNVQLNEYITHNVHGIVVGLAPYAGDETGQTMKPYDVGTMLHYADEIKREFVRLGQDKQRLFERDIVALEDMNTTVHNRIQLINSMYQTYNLATVPV